VRTLLRFGGARDSLVLELGERFAFVVLERVEGGAIGVSQRLDRERVPGRMRDPQI